MTTALDGELELEPCVVARIPTAAATPTTPATIRIFAVLLKPPGDAEPATLLCVIVALAVAPSNDAVTRICMVPD